MFVDFTAQSLPTLWVLAAALALLAVIIFAGIDPELAEVYLGDVPVLLGTVALAAVVLAMLGSHHAEATNAVGQLLPSH